MSFEGNFLDRRGVWVTLSLLGYVVQLKAGRYMGNLWMREGVFGRRMAQIIPISETLNLLTHPPVSVRKWWPHSSLTQCNCSEKFRSPLKRSLNQHHHDDENDDNRYEIVCCLRNSSTNLTEMSPSTQRSYNLNQQLVPHLPQLEAAEQLFELVSNDETIPPSNITLPGGQGPSMVTQSSHICWLILN